MVEGRFCFLRPVIPSDLELLRILEQSGDDAAMYRFRGRSVGPDEYRASIWDASLLHLTVIELSELDRPAGLMALYGTDWRNSTARLAGIIDPRLRGGPTGIEAFKLFLGYCFKTFPLRKVYAEVLEDNLTQFRSVVSQGLAKVEGQLKEHEFCNGRYVDQFIIAFHKDSWGEDAVADFGRSLADSSLDRTSRRARWLRAVGGRMGWSEVSEYSRLDDLGVDSLVLFELGVIASESRGSTVDRARLEAAVLLRDIIDLALGE